MIQRQRSWVDLEPLLAQLTRVLFGIPEPEHIDDNRKAVE